MLPVVEHSLRYNRSLDGLRGIAVTLVVLFHIWPEYFSFGYVGVDIFFVLSGYLISKIIITKSQTQSFSIVEFYRNRVRRIFPAMLIVVITIFLAGYLFLFPWELEQLALHIKSSLLFFQNFRLAGEAGYWDEAGQLKPLLHFWSLSIEEQFYFVWPFVVMLLAAMRVNYLAGLAVIAGVLILLPQLLHIDGFYNSLSRFWELAFGGLIYAVEKDARYLPSAVKFKYPVLLFFVGSVALCTGNTDYSAVKTFLVVLATGLLILYFAVRDDSRLFTSAPLVFLGLVSFPLYLWHYVLISYSHIFGISVTAYGVVIIAVAVILSYLIYRYVEIYTRKQNSIKFALLLVAISISITMLAHFVSAQKGLPQRAFYKPDKGFEEQFIRTEPYDDKALNILQAVIGYKPPNDYFRATSDDLSKKFIVLIGDSHAHAAYSGFAKVFKDDGYETLLLANSSCPPYVGGATGTTKNKAMECEAKIKSIYQMIDKMPNIKKVIFVARGPSYIKDRGFGFVDGGGKPYRMKMIDCFSDLKKKCDPKDLYGAIEKTFALFGQKKIKLYYLLENPELGFNVKNCLSRPFGIFPKECKVAYSAYIARQNGYRQTIASMAERYPGVTILDPEPLFCDGKFCDAVIDGKMLYADDDHLSVEGAIKQAQMFRNRITDH